jgi:predicted Rossmann fold nucleotide-binding protein DprA/Smf involved in DNA uptake
MDACVLTAIDARYPARVRERLGDGAPAQLTTIGNLALLAMPKTALFCSAKAPGATILHTYDDAQRMRDGGITVISGFHSPIEKECLRILLRGKQPIIVCPARSIESMRIPPDCKAAFEAGRSLFLSPFFNKPKRVTKDSALYRNKVVAALADEAYIPHVSPGGRTAQIIDMLKKWLVPLRTP